MSYSPEVVYWLNTGFKNKKNRSKCLGVFCFSEIKRVYNPYSSFKLSDGKRLFYKCILPTKSQHLIPITAQKFYINFILELFSDYKIKTRFTKENNIFWMIQLNNPKQKLTTETSRLKLLTILTLCRYLQEFPEIVNHFFENKKENLGDNFLQFQESHYKTRSVYYDNRLGHAAINACEGSPFVKEKLINYDYFMKKFKRNEFSGVQNLFNNN